MIGRRTKVGILGDPHPVLNSRDFFVQRCFFFFVCQREFSGNRRVWCRKIHLQHATFSHVQSLHRTHSTDDMCTMAQVVRRKISLHPRVMSHPLLHATLSTSSLSFSSVSPVLLSSSPNRDLLSTDLIFHFEDPRQDGTSLRNTPPPHMKWRRPFLIACTAVITVHLPRPEADDHFLWPNLYSLCLGFCVCWCWRHAARRHFQGGFQLGSHSLQMERTLTDRVRMPLSSRFQCMASRF